MGADQLHAQESTMVVHPGFVVQQGAPNARGAIIWSPGTDTDRLAHPSAATGGMPHFVDWLYGNGWDVFYMERTGGIAFSDRRRHGAAIQNAAIDLKSRGYGKIVLAGQSSGGTYTLYATQQPLPIDAVLLIASGPSSGQEPFTQLLAGVKAPKIFVTHMAEDRTIGQRSRGEVQAALSATGATSWNLHEPAGITGHSGGFSSGFSYRYGDCILNFIATQVGQSDSRCLQ